ncbi:hypothetical protein CAOG_07497 [Capsaspora owczarzaki ATCC 30864]|uniref:Amino acid permease n=1 Tax=Capsaspora owczarzaki (strain ATCC 30864) TaxID=595528 RepID=A0A0D2X513_CAPO3|nr:hypothetical protein CAOG_07497 [Capsaspora owczarzaki ATCC 30864]KJE97009.1 hypothetical protein CAOG_007497 [Capsaspora owczarzaki ATCC 30864]|eukprot:XP_004343371.2 hypothetical protein CAOG_07497 [Capsaspora owczarzaki ATCC 30864]
MSRLLARALNRPGSGAGSGSDGSSEGSGGGEDNEMSSQTLLTRRQQLQSQQSQQSQHSHQSYQLAQAQSQSQSQAQSPSQSGNHAHLRQIHPQAATSALTVPSSSTLQSGRWSGGSGSSHSASHRGGSSGGGGGFSMTSSGNSFSMSSRRAADNDPVGLVFAPAGVAEWEWAGKGIVEIVHTDRCPSLNFALPATGNAPGAALPGTTTTTTTTTTTAAAAAARSGQSEGVIADGARQEPPVLQEQQSINVNLLRGVERLGWKIKYPPVYSGGIESTKHYFADGGDDDDEIDLDGDDDTTAAERGMQPQQPSIKRSGHAHGGKESLLGQFMATAICANDITSSVLYTAGVVASYAGYLAPICLLLVVLLLHLFRRVYVEVVTALPLNGGTYTAILNTGPKSAAVFAGCLSFLSYVATAVVSGTNAIQYLQVLWTDLDGHIATILLFVLFAALMLFGVTESAKVAFAICSVHMLTLATLCMCALVSAFRSNWSVLADNFERAPPSNIPLALFYGFSSAMLGISGFESSSNFVEQQKPGVFAKTLRNMWLMVAIINPVVSLLSFSVLPPSVLYPNNGTVYNEAAAKALLATMADQMEDELNGAWLKRMIVVDAVLVLSGAVLTSFVGVIGLFLRMSADRCLPGVFLKRLPYTQANYVIILFFLLVCSSLFLIANGELQAIGGVYTVAFLSVMALFGCSNLALKNTRSTLKSEAHAPLVGVITAIVGVIVAWIGNVVLDSQILLYFFMYFVGFLAIALSMFFRSAAIRTLLHAIKDRTNASARVARFQKWLVQLLHDIEREPVIFFSKHGDLVSLNRAIQYVEDNEQTRIVKVVHFFESPRDIPEELFENIAMLDRCYPAIRIDAMLVTGPFRPEMIAFVADRTQIPPNRCFIGCPSPRMTYNIRELGGLRIIVPHLDRTYARLVRLWREHLQLPAPDEQRALPAGNVGLGPSGPARKQQDTPAAAAAAVAKVSAPETDGPLLLGLGADARSDLSSQPHQGRDAQFQQQQQQQQPPQQQQQQMGASFQEQIHGFAPVAPTALFSLAHQTPQSLSAPPQPTSSHPIADFGASFAVPPNQHHQAMAKPGAEQQAIAQPVYSQGPQLAREDDHHNYHYQQPRHQPASIFEVFGVRSLPHSGVSLTFSSPAKAAAPVTPSVPAPVVASEPTSAARSPPAAPTASATRSASASDDSPPKASLSRNQSRHVFSVQAVDTMDDDSAAPLVDLSVAAPSREAEEQGGKAGATTRRFEVAAATETVAPTTVSASDETSKRSQVVEARTEPASTTEPLREQSADAGPVGDASAAPHSLAVSGVVENEEVL